MTDSRLPVVLSQQEVKLIIDSASNSASNMKHRTFISLIYSCGLRVSELVNLKLNDIDSSRMQIRIQLAKGAKDRYVMLSEKILLILREYWKQYRTKQYLFEGNTPGKAIAVRTVQTTFANAVVKSGIKKTSHCTFVQAQFFQPIYWKKGSVCSLSKNY